MRNASEMYKPYQLITPQLAAATVTGTGVQFTPNNDSGADAVAVVNIGAIAGAPSATSLIVTIEQSATVGGTYTVTGTFATATAASEVSTLPVKLDTTKPFVRAKATIAFTSGTSPTIAVGVLILVKQNNNSANNATALS